MRADDAVRGGSGLAEPEQEAIIDIWQTETRSLAGLALASSGKANLLAQQIWAEEINAKGDQRTAT